MAIWQCSVCKEQWEVRCAPKKCPKCGAEKDALEKQEKPKA